MKPNRRTIITQATAGKPAPLHGAALRHNALAAALGLVGLVTPIGSHAQPC